MSTGLVIKITQPGTIQVNSFIVGDKTVDASTFIQFTITPSVKYLTNGYIEIVVPSPMSLSSPVSCNPITGMVGTATSGCTRTNSTDLIFTRDLSKSLLVTFYQVQFSIYNFNNILGAMQNNPFNLYFKNSDGSIVA